MKTKQKKFKFSKGEINEKLLERQDLAILESSASYIKNMISTPYGALKTREGTQSIAKIATNKTIKNPTVVTNNIGGTTASITDFVNMFESNGIGATNELIKFDYNASGNIYKVYLENCCFKFTAPVLTANIVNGVITSVNIDTAGVGLNDVTITAKDVRGSGATFTVTTDDAGSITNVVVVTGGTNYTSSTTILVDYDLPEEAIKLQASADALTWTDIDSYSVTNIETDFVTQVDASYRYIRLYMDNLIDTKLRLFNLSSYDESATITTSKILPFVFNLNQKYVLVLKNESILAYENDVLVATITATGLLDTYFDTLKTAQAEDTMIFTHPDMRTKQLQRTFASQAYTNDPAAGANIVLNMTSTADFALNDVVIVSSSAGSEKATVTNIVANTSITVNSLALNHTTTNPLVTSTTLLEWVFSDFPWTNVPFMLFGAEVVTNPAQTLTPSADEGSVKLTAGGAVFTAASVGQLIDGGGGRVRITQYESGTVVYGYTIIPFYTTAAIASGTWDYITGYEEVWSSARGYPTTCMFYQQRLWFGGSKGKPNTIWASRVGQYNSFENVANYDNDAINATISSEQIDEIVNMYANRGIQIFTAGAEWVVPEGATTANSITFSKNTSNGSLDSVVPVDISGITMFIERNGKSLLSFAYTDSQAAFVTESMSLLSGLVNDPVGIAVDYNSSKDVGNFIYMPMADGTMAVFCVMIGQDINAPVRFETDGDILDVTNVSGDTYVLVDRKDVIYLEKLGYQKTDWTKTFTPVASVINGLSDYNGYYVRVYDDSKDYGTYFVMNGTITLTGWTSGNVYLGKTFDYEMISTKIAVNGQTENIEKRIAKATIATANTPKLTFCGQTISQTDEVYDIYGVTGFSRDCRFTITGEFDYVEILSILLNINYGEK